MLSQEVYPGKPFLIEKYALMVEVFPFFQTFFAIVRHSLQRM